MTEKACPILTAGAAGAIIADAKLGIGISQFIHEFCVCGREVCEWYGHGCPAYPDHLSTVPAKKEDGA